jgi:hypothetical protein
LILVGQTGPVQCGVDNGRAGTQAHPIPHFKILAWIEAAPDGLKPIQLGKMGGSVHALFSPVDSTG